MSTSDMDRNNTSYPLFMYNYLKDDPKIGDNETGDDKLLDTPGTLLYHQKLVILYILRATVRGILLWHDMGSGKTRIPVALVKTILMSGRKFVFIGPKGLHDNIRKEFDKVGITVPKDKVQFISLNASNMFDQVTRMETENVQFKADVSKDVNEEDFAKDERLKDVTTKQEGLPGLSGTTALDDTFVFIDEAHKFFNAITNGSKNALNLYDLIMGAKNIKLMFGTGTAIVNTPFELCPCFNMLSGKKIFPEDRGEFEELFIGVKKDGTRYIKNAKVFKNRMVGLVSYYGKWVQDPQKSAGIKPEQLPMEVVKVPMSNKQFARYALYSDKEKQEQTFANKQSGRFAASKSVSSYRVKTRMTSIAIPVKDTDSSINNEKGLIANLKDPSNCPKFYQAKTYIEQTPKGIIMIYCDFVHGPGLERMGKFLEYIMGYSRWNTKTDNAIKDSRYIVISGDVSTDERTEMQDITNSKENMWGDHIKIILVGPAGALGLDFKGIQLEILLNPSFTMAQTDQVVARGIRNYSHKHLPKKFQKVRVIMLIATEPLSETKKTKKKTIISKKSKKGGAFKDYVIDYIIDENSVETSLAAYDKFETVDSSHYSSTMPWHILQVHGLLKKRVPNFEKLKEIMDATANVGVDSIHFAANTDARVAAVELMKPEFEALKKNIEIFSYQKRVIPIHMDIYKVVDKMIKTKKTVDLMYFDPPWGGSNYKDKAEDSLMLTLSKKGVYDIVNKVFKNKIATYVVLKVPLNFAFTEFRKKMNTNLDMKVDTIEHEKSKKKGFKIITLHESSTSGGTSSSDPDKKEQTTDEYLFEYSQKNKILNLKATRFIIEAAIDCQLHKKRLKNKKQADKINCLMCTPTNVPLFHDDYKLDADSKYDPCKPPDKTQIKAREIILGDKKYMYTKDTETSEYTFFEHNDDLDGFVALKKDAPEWSELFNAAKKAKKIKGSGIDF
jgi:tRNA1(Val) A37 N6-methylase TrmN6